MDYQHVTYNSRVKVENAHLPKMAFNHPCFERRFLTSFFFNPSIFILYCADRHQRNPNSGKDFDPELGGIGTCHSDEATFIHLWHHQSRYVGVQGSKLCGVNLTS